MSVKQEIYHCLRNLKEADQTDKEDEYVLHSLTPSDLLKSEITEQQSRYLTQD